MQPKALTGRDRDEALRTLEESGAGGPVLDVLVIGGGVTGAGTALDATTRGLSTALVEAGDWVKAAEPPKGPAAFETTPTLRPIMPVSMRSIMRWPRLVSSVKT